MSVNKPGFDSDNVLAKARLKVYSESDAYKRSLMLARSIKEGDTLGIDFAYAAYNEIGEEDDHDPRVHQPRDQKSHAGIELVRALSQNGRYDAAYDIAQDMQRLGVHAANSVYCELLSHGYAGPNNELLELFDTERLYASTGNGEAERAEQYHYAHWLVALARYGVDLSGGDERYANHIKAFVETGSYAPAIQYHLRNIVVAYAESDRIDLALKIKDLITCHTTKGTSVYEIAKNIPTSGPVENSGQLLDLFREIDALRVESESCQGGCVNHHCDPQRDGKELGLMQAVLAVRTGMLDLCRQLLDFYDKGFYFPELRLDAYIELYGRTGLDSDRNQCLYLLNQIGCGDRQYARSLIGRIAELDTLLGRTIILTDDGEPLPLILWQVKDIYSEPTEFDQMISGTYTPPDSHNDMELIKALYPLGGGDPNNMTEEFDESSQRRKREQVALTFGILASELARLHYFSIAEQTANMITDSHHEYVGALTSIVRYAGSDRLVAPFRVT